MSISLICAKPVIPGLALYTSSFSLSLVSSVWLARPGLGPTRLISPLITFHNCGNSSSFVFLKKRPNFVIADESARCVATDSVSGFIVLNLSSVKVFLCRPSRRCLNTGDPVSKRPIRVRTINNGLSSISPKNEKIMSNSLSILASNDFLYQVCCFFSVQTE